MTSLTTRWEEAGFALTSVRVSLKRRRLSALVAPLQVWDSYFYLSVIFINQPCLQLEAFSPSKRKKTLEKWVFALSFGPFIPVIGAVI